MNNMKKLTITLAALSSLALANNVTLTNYLGTQEKSLILELSDNQAHWDQYDINYGMQGNVPMLDKKDADGNKGWSSWNIRKGTGEYCGTVTLQIDGKNNMFISNFVAPTSPDGCTISGLVLCKPKSELPYCDHGNNYYSMVVGSIQ